MHVYIVIYMDYWKYVLLSDLLFIVPVLMHLCYYLTDALAFQVMEYMVFLALPRVTVTRKHAQICIYVCVCIYPSTHINRYVCECISVFVWWPCPYARLFLCFLGCIVVECGVSFPSFFLVQFTY